VSAMIWRRGGNPKRITKFLTQYPNIPITLNIQTFCDLFKTRYPPASVVVEARNFEAARSCTCRPCFGKAAMYAVKAAL
jgi:hypothetical protein